MRVASRCTSSPWHLILLIVILPLAWRGADAGERATHPSAARPGGAPVTCDAAVRHPIQIRIEALDPIRRGATVRLRVTSRSSIGLAGAEARVVSPGTATLLGRPRAALGAMQAEREANADFVVTVPAQGDRHLIQFRVEGEGPAGRIGRGATFNILPDGPSAPVRIVTGAQGQAIAEHRARRRP